MKISIPKPCHEDWNNMMPEGQGRFCSVCAKTVIDFSTWSTPDIQNYFAKYYGQRICGRFKATQLSGIEIIIPQQHLYKIPRHQTFLWALFIVFGTTLFGCTDDAGNKRKFDRVAIEDRHREMGGTAGEPVAHVEPNQPADAVQVKEIEVPMPGVEEPRLGDYHLTGGINWGKPVELSVDTGSTSGLTDNMVKGKMLMGDIVVPPNAQPKVHGMAEEMAKFNGGYDSMNSYLTKNIVYPDIADRKSGKVFVSFTVGADGQVRNIKIEKSLGPSYDDEVIRVIQLMPRWKPAKQNGMIVDTKITLPVTFSE